MDYTGTIFAKTENDVAQLEATTVGDLVVCQVKVSGNMVIQFPLPGASDSNEIALRTGNIVNQTHLVDNPVRVIVEPVE